ncbi:hypothetical protein, partial [Spongiactinospora sp. 9N601]|uniref:hypothetical protein n=1 Tax=Spongiactinospora sp. 9N601 TaxID=3375149 RepID=UPI00379E2446
HAAGGGTGRGLLGRIWADRHGAPSSATRGRKNAKAKNGKSKNKGRGGQDGGVRVIRRRWRRWRKFDKRATKALHGRRDAAYAAVRAWWRRRRNTNPDHPDQQEQQQEGQGDAQDQQAQDEDEGQGAAAAAPDPADPADQQDRTDPAAHPAAATTTTSTSTNTRGTSMSAFTLHTAAAELPAAASRYSTEDMMDVATHLDLLGEVPIAVANGFRIWAERLLAEYPVHQDVIERLQNIYSAQARLSAECQEAALVFRARHEYDIARRVAPRSGERKWNA